MVSMTASPLAALGAEGGGRAIHVEALSRALAARGHEVVVYTRRDSRDLPADARISPGVTVRHVDAGPPRPLPADAVVPFMPRFAGELAEAWLSGPPDVAHAHFWDSAVTAAQAAAVASVPVAVTFHGLASAAAGPPGRLDVESRLSRSMAQVIAASAAEVRELVLLGAPPERLAVVPGGVDTAWFSPWADLPSTGSGRPRLLSLGDLTPGSGVADAIRLVAQVPLVELLVVGGPPAAGLGGDPDVARLSLLAQELEVADRVTFLGRVPRAEMPFLIRSADVVVCLPWHELSSREVLEAMACARPVVATAVGALLDVVEDGVTGVLVQPESPNSAAAAVRGLLADPGRRVALGEQALARARGRFDWQRVARATERVYQVMRVHSLTAGIPLARVPLPVADPREAPQPLV